MSIKERIKFYADHVGITIKDFEIKSGMSNGYIGAMRKGLGVEKLDNVLSAFPDLSRDWLLTGEGSMQKDDKPKYDEVTPVPESAYMMVEYIDLRASAGKIGGESVGQLPESHKRLVPREYTTGRFLVVRVDGDSMNDGTIRSLSDGDEVLIKVIESEHWNELPIRKSLFVITSREGNVLKQIKEINKEQGYIFCHSFNPAYEDFKLAIDDIFQIFIVRKIVQKQISLT